MESPHLPTRYAPPVTQIIHQEAVEDYKKMGQTLNASSAEIIHLQHEFGLFGGEAGAYILQLTQELTKPLIVTFHTVLLTPNNQQKYIIQELARSSTKIVVMDEIAKSRLEQVYGLDSRDFEIIAHGAPLIDISKKRAKKSIHFEGKFILLAINLLSKNKGIEYAIEAVSSAVKRIPNLVFLVVGETHPLVKIEEGEAYREKLIQLVKKLKLEEYVIFKNEYVTPSKLKVILAAADVYITPYLDPQQIASGTLAYAIGAGKACISTKYVYAEDLFSNGRGTLVPFRDSKAIAKALIQLYKNPGKLHKEEKEVQSLRKEMLWSNVAKKHIVLYKKVLTAEKNISETAHKFLDKPIDISYLSHLTDSTGLMQHAYRTIPNRKFGYSTDDNARALIVVSKLYNQHKSSDLLQLIKQYVGFLQFAQEEDGKFHSFLDSNGHWVDKEDINDPYGKAMWALGYNLYISKNHTLTQSIHSLFSSSLEQLDNVRDLRTIAYSLLGLYYYILAYESRSDVASAAMRYMRKLADTLIKAYEKTNGSEWSWFEQVVTYDNFRLPQALFAAYMVTRDRRYRKTALSTLDFITSCNFNENKDFFDFVGQNGWFEKGKVKAEYDQQPLEAAAAVEAFMFASKALNNREYKKKALLAFEWFFGRNRNHRYIYDKTTKGVHDGLTLRGVNQNEGAESIVCFLMANISLQEIRKEV